MPEISRFNGIRITMYHGEHEHPSPHFHAEHGDDEAQICIHTGTVLVGSLPASSLRLVRRWRSIHHAELDANWILAMRNEPPSPIAPLRK